MYTAYKYNICWIVGECFLEWSRVKFFFGHGRFRIYLWLFGEDQMDLDHFEMMWNWLEAAHGWDWDCTSWPIGDS